MTLAFGAAALGEVVQGVADGQRRRDPHAPLHEESSGEPRLDQGRGGGPAPSLFTPRVLSFAIDFDWRSTEVKNTWIFFNWRGER